MPVIKPANPKTCKKAQTKKDIIKKIKELAKQHPIIGIINMENLPAGNLLKMKHKLRGQVELYMTRKTLTKLALESLKLPGGDALIAELKGMPALLFTKENPFKIYRIIKQSKSPSPAKAGQAAPKDIVLPKGPTPFGPGPIISEFAMLGIKAGVEEGKVAIKEDTTVVKEGQPISAQLASMLQKLGVEPMEVGLDLRCVYENGIVYPKKILDVDEKQFIRNLHAAIQNATNLSVEACIPTKDSVQLLIQKASRQARSIAHEGNIMAKGLQEEIIAKLHNIAASIANQTK